MSRVTRAAAAHVSPSLFCSQKTTTKVINSIQAAAKRNADLIAFPEAFISAFPVWSSFLPPSKCHHFFQRQVESSIYADGEEIAAVRDQASRSKIIVSLGFSEKARFSSGTLWNSNLLIGSEGEVLVHHRKLQPTWFEKLTWAPGDGYGLKVAHTSKGKIGALICGENTNTLARYAMLAQGEEIHISSWPGSWPTSFEEPNAKNVSSGYAQPKNYDNVSANRIRAAAHCFEAKAFGILCAPCVSEENIETIASLSDEPDRSRKILLSVSKAASMFLDPSGAQIEGFIFDSEGIQRSKYLLSEEEDIIYADLDLTRCVEGKQYHDLVGSYQRMDVFDFKVNRRRHEPVVFTETS